MIIGDKDMALHIKILEGVTQKFVHCFLAGGVGEHVAQLGPVRANSANDGDIATSLLWQRQMIVVIGVPPDPGYLVP